MLGRQAPSSRWSTDHYIFYNNAIYVKPSILRGGGTRYHHKAEEVQFKNNILINAKREEDNDKKKQKESAKIQ